MTVLITNILFATDLSKNSTYALRHAACIAKPPVLLFTSFT